MHSSEGIFKKIFTLAKWGAGYVHIFTIISSPHLIVRLPQLNPYSVVFRLSSVPDSGTSASQGGYPDGVLWSPYFFAIPAGLAGYDITLRQHHGEMQQALSREFLYLA